eukprot:g59855.t1
MVEMKIWSYADTDCHFYLWPGVRKKPIVVATHPNGPAHKAGLKSGMKVVAVDHTAISSTSDFSHYLKNVFAGDSLHITARYPLPNPASSKRKKLKRNGDDQWGPEKQFTILVLPQAVTSASTTQQAALLQAHTSQTFFAQAELWILKGQDALPAARTASAQQPDLEHKRLADLVVALLESRYEEVLDRFEHLFSFLPDLHTNGAAVDLEAAMEDAAEKFCKSYREMSRMCLLVCGAALLGLFVQINYTGLWSSTKGPLSTLLSTTTTTKSGIAIESEAKQSQLSTVVSSPPLSVHTRVRLWVRRRNLDAPQLKPPSYTLPCSSQSDSSSFAHLKSKARRTSWEGGWSVLDCLSRRSLCMDGEQLYARTCAPALLSLSRALFLSQTLQTDFSSSLSWWRLRCVSVHQQMLMEPAASLKKAFEEALEPALSYTKLQPADQILHARLCLEAGHALQRYWHYGRFQSLLVQAKEALNLQTHLTGVLGIRTKWQKVEKAQIVVFAASEKIQANAELQKECKANELTSIRRLPRVIPLESDVLLERPALSSIRNQSPDGLTSDSCLTIEQQAAVLGEAVAVKYRNPPGDPITVLEQLAYVERVLTNDGPLSWAVQYWALHQRSLLERKDHHKHDRALLQLEALVQEYSPAQSVDGGKGREAEYCALAEFRARDLWLVGLPPGHTFQASLAETLMGLGMVAAALELYEQLELWDKAVECYLLMGRRTDAEVDAEVVLRGLLDLDPCNSHLWCLLGDVMGNPDFYLKGWNASGGKHGAAMRALGKYKMDRQLYEEAIEHYNLALEQNSAFPTAWYALGYAALELERHEEAVRALSRVVSLDPEYGNAWNNLAAAHLHRKEFPQAFSALKQAVRFNRDSWKTWENYLLASMVTLHWGEAMAAMEQVVNFKGARNVDVEMLKKLTEISLKDIEKQESEKAPVPSFLAERLIRMLAHIESKTCTNPEVWHSAAVVHAASGRHAQAIEYAEKEVRDRQADGNWLLNMDQFQQAVDAISLLISLYQRSADAARGEHLYAAKLCLETSLTKAKESPCIAPDHSGLGALAELLASVEGSLGPSREQGSVCVAPASCLASLDQDAATDLSMWQ